MFGAVIAIVQLYRLEDYDRVHLLQFLNKGGIVMTKVLISLLLLSVAIPLDAKAEQHFRIKLAGKSVEFDTGTGMHKVNGIERSGLIAASARKGQTFMRYWQPGAFRETISLNDDHFGGWNEHQ